MLTQYNYISTSTVLKYNFEVLVHKYFLLMLLLLYYISEVNMYFFTTFIRQMNEVILHN